MCGIRELSFMNVNMQACPVGNDHYL
ncbi:DUF4751 domain-containing protein, partial [Salmonella enterica subsp. enterica serovar Schwarzengrund]|nr:DUF4751 domain-containing protein [Salmonella enterica subsp. enterica serovar Schwarzengrund]